MSSKRLFQSVAEQIASLIDEGAFPPGTRLPGERELAERLGELLETRRKSWAESLHRAEEGAPHGKSSPSASQRSLAHRIRAFFGQG